MKVVLALIFVAILAVFVEAQTVSGSIGNGSVKRGATARGVITLDIPEGLHVNSNQPNNEYAIPTTVKISSSNAIVGRVSYPRGKAKKFSFNEAPIYIYEGRVRFTFPVKVPAKFKGKTVSVRAVVRYQACTDEVCYPPREKEITITAKVT